MTIWRVRIACWINKATDTHSAYVYYFLILHGNNCYVNAPQYYVIRRGSIRSTRGLGPTMTARGQSIGISIGMLPQTLIMAWRLASLLGRRGGDYGTKDIQVLHYGIWPWRRILNGACISISNLPENIAWQTHRPEARGPLKSGAWGGRPTCHPQTPPLVICTLLVFLVLKAICDFSRAQM